MRSYLETFELIARATVAPAQIDAPDHPFEVRGYAALFPAKVQKLFDDGHYSQASFEAYKYIEQILRDKSGNANGYGAKLISYALEGESPRVILSCPSSENYQTFRDNFQKMIMGAFGNIRNPKGHKSIDQGLDDCLDELTIAAYFIRIIDPAPANSQDVMDL